MVSGIYKITCLCNNKIYIGSSIDIQKRKYDHFRELLLNSHGNPKLQHAYNLYGKNNFEFEIIEIVEKTKNESDLEFRRRLVKEKEQYYLDRLLFAKEKNNKFRELCFNIHRIADSPMGLKHSDESRKKMSINNARKGKPNWNSGKKMSPEVLEKIIDTKKKNGTLNKPKSEEWKQKISRGNTGKKASLETRKKQSLARIGKSPINKGVPRSQETKEKISISKKGTISWNKGIKCRKETKAKLSIVNKGRKHTEEELNKVRKPVLQFNKNTGELIKEWKSIADASMALNINKGNISSSCCNNNKYKTVGGFIWKHKNQ